MYVLHTLPPKITRLNLLKKTIYPEEGGDKHMKTHKILVVFSLVLVFAIAGCLAFSPTQHPPTVTMEKTIEQQISAKYPCIRGPVYKNQEILLCPVHENNIERVYTIYSHFTDERKNTENDIMVLPEIMVTP